MLRLRITCVDMAGFTGRDYHPQPEDVGLEVVALRMEAWDMGLNDIGAGEPEPLLSEGGRPRLTEEARALCAPACRGAFEAAVTEVWTCVTESGRLLELMAHEVELVLPLAPLEREPSHALGVRR